MRKVGAGAEDHSPGSSSKCINKRPHENGSPWQYPTSGSRRLRGCFFSCKHVFKFPPPVCFEHIEKSKLTRTKGSTEVGMGRESASQVDQDCMLVCGQLRLQIRVRLEQMYIVKFSLAQCCLNTIERDGNLSAGGGFVFDIFAINCQASPRLLRGIPKPTAPLIEERSGTVAEVFRKPGRKKSPISWQRNLTTFPSL